MITWHKLKYSNPCILAPWWSLKPLIFLNFVYLIWQNFKLKYQRSLTSVYKDLRCRKFVQVIIYFEHEKVQLKYLQPWLLEINSSPALGPTTHITARLCANVLDDVIKVSSDLAYCKNGGKNSYKEKYFTRIRTKKNLTPFLVGYFGSKM